MLQKHWVWVSWTHNVLILSVTSLFDDTKSAGLVHVNVKRDDPVIGEVLHGIPDITVYTVIQATDGSSGVTLVDSNIGSDSSPCN